MAEILCINIPDLCPLEDSDEEGTAIKTLTQIVPADAEVSQVEIVDSVAVSAKTDEGTGLEIEAIAGQTTTLTTYTRDLESSSETIPTATANHEYLGQFSNYAAQQLYQDISTAFAQRTLVGIDVGTAAAGEPEAALNHYLTVAIISFINRVSGDAGAFETLDEDGE